MEANETTGAASVALAEVATDLPDVLTELRNRTQPTRYSFQLCTGLDDFKRSPQQLPAAQAFNHCKRQALVGGIKYQRG